MGLRFEEVFDLQVRDVVRNYVDKFLKDKISSDLLERVINQDVLRVFGTFVGNSVDGFLKLFLDERLSEDEKRARIIALLVLLDAIIFDRVIAWGRNMLYKIIRDSCKECKEKILRNDFLRDIEVFSSSVGFLLGVGGFVFKEDGIDVDLFLGRMNEQMLRAVYLAVISIFIFCLRVSSLVGNSLEKENLH